MQANEPNWIKNLDRQRNATRPDYTTQPSTEQPEPDTETPDPVFDFSSDK